MSETFIAIFLVVTVVYWIGVWMGIRHHKITIRNKQSIGVLVIEEQDNGPANIYLAIDSYERLKYEGSEIILQVKRK